MDRLGRGLDALFQETTSRSTTTYEPGTLAHIKTSDIRPNRYQPRQNFISEDLAMLINSIREKGILQPIIVRPLNTEEGTYEIIAGERRWRAAKTLNFEDVPVIIRHCSDSEALELALIENIQRHNLDPLEEAEGFQRLIQEFDYTQEQLSLIIGKSRSHISNTLRLLNLPDAIKKLIQERKITAGHARALLSHPEPEALVEKILSEGMTVRTVEKTVKKETLPRPEKTYEGQEQEISDHLTQALSMPTQVKLTKNGGILTIHFKTIEQMDDLIEKLRS